ncbi:hypothetical protein ACOME3_004227 [Neoechinorhynchus agilis]
MAKPQLSIPSICISSLTLRNFTSEEAAEIGSCSLTVYGSKDDLKNKLPGSVYDLHMGPYDYSNVCLSCRRDYNSCPGHYGVIRLALPIYNPMYFDKLIFLLKATCFSCMRITVPTLDKLVFCVEMLLIDHGCYDELENLNEYHMRLRSDKKSDFEISMLLKKKCKAILSECTGKENLMCQNEVALKMKTFRKFDDLMRGAKKRCMFCKHSKPTLTHDNIFDIFDSSETKHKRIGPEISRVTNFTNDDWVTFDDLISDDNQVNDKPELDDIKGTPINLHQRGYIPLNIKYILDNLWKNEPVFLKIYYQSLSSNLCDKFMITNLIVPPNSNTTAAPNDLRRIFDLYREAAKSDEDLNLNDEDSQENPPKATGLRKSLYSTWKNLQVLCGQLYDVRYAMTRNVNPYKGLRGLLEGKEGLIRKNIMGKRVDYSGRSVISPDPFIATHEIGIPEAFAVRLDYCEPVNTLNVKKLQMLVLNGPNTYPGARFVRFEDGRVVRLKPNDAAQRKAIANQLAEFPSCSLKPKMVYRHLLDGDYLIVNRQPTLHRPSLMGHSARVLKNEKVLRLHYSNCKSYNADFDGDELNVHFPQDEVSRTEVSELMFSTWNYATPKDGSPLGGLIHDHIIASAKLTVKGRFFTRDQYVHLITQAFTGTSFYDRLVIVPPCIIKPQQLWSGKQVISTVLQSLIPPNQSGINLESSAKVAGKYWYKQRDSSDSNSQYDDPLLSEETVIFRNGQLMCGIIDKNQIGSAPKGLIHCCQELYDGYFANAILSALSRLLTSYLQFYAGFTLGAEDILLNAPIQRVESIIASRVQAGRDALRKFSRITTNDDEIFAQIIRKAHQSIDESLMIELDAAYKSITDKLQSQMTNALFSKCKDICAPLKSFPSNDLHLMILAGAKGSPVNALQMSCMLGQQELEGRRPALMVSGASLPCFEPYDLLPDAGGFIYNSFATGLRPHEYFFHCMAGREGLVDTAVKTSRSGYLQRCLVKHLEGLCVQYDMTVRNTDGSIIQFCYGEDSVATEKATFLKPNSFKLFTNNVDIVTKGNGQSAYEKCTCAPMKSEVLRKRLKAVRKWVKRNDQRDCEDKQKARRTSRKWEKIEYPVVSDVLPGTRLEAISEHMYDLISEYSDSKLSVEKEKCKDILKAGIESSLPIMYRSLRALAEPGDAVGILAAQSIGEPSTQMTLNTFHFAGRGEMNVTLGIPRLREILMTTTRNMKTPLMEVPIRKGKKRKAERLQLRLQRRVFKEVILKVNINENCQYCQNSSRGIMQIYEMHFDFTKQSDCDIVRAFETRFVRKLLNNINARIKNQQESNLFKTVIAKSKPAGESATENKDDDEKGEEVEDISNQGKVREDDEDEEDDVIGDDGDGGRLRKRQDDEMSYDGEEEDENEMLEQQADATDHGEDIPLVDGLDSSCGTPIPKKSKTSMDNARIEDVLAICRKGGVTIIDYRYGTSENEDKVWCALTIGINACYGQLNMTSLVDFTARSLAVRSSDAIRKCGIIPMGVNQELYMQVEGINFDEIFAHDRFFNLNRFYCNSIPHMCETYGIEACQRECQKVFSAYGINVDFRHLSLVADYLTFNGQCTAFNRHSMASSSSPLQKMSFETATNVIKDCVLRGFRDPLQGPSGRQFVGTPPRIGTGMVDIICVPME